jgi:hypothetical protein
VKNKNVIKQLNEGNKNYTYLNKKKIVRGANYLENILPNCFSVRA